ncbi:MAG: pantoate--beta-alanine ligase [Calditrichia bacterium]
MLIVKDIAEMQSLADGYRLAGKKIGFVPTMGYLHEGHLSLMRLTRPQCDILVVSIFVNPTQFGPHEDLDKYPRDFERDEELCRQEHADVLFYPDTLSMYPDPYYTYINVEKLSATLCGHSRPNHFRGVATVVAKLFNIIKPHLATFGEKDFQQAVIIRRMVRDLNFDVEILTGPIVREADGLAMSSRNKYLSAEDRKKALALYGSLQLVKELIDSGEKDAGKIRTEMENFIRQGGGVEIDYIAIVNPETLKDVATVADNTLIALAVKVGGTRLIDNMVVKE